MRSPYAVVAIRPLGHTRFSVPARSPEALRREALRADTVGMIAITATVSATALLARAFALAVVGASLVVPVASTLAHNLAR